MISSIESSEIYDRDNKKKKKNQYAEMIALLNN